MICLFSSRLLRCIGTFTIEASIICPFLRTIAVLTEIIVEDGKKLGNLAAIDDFTETFLELVVIIESGGDKLSATFSPELAELAIYVVDVAAR